MLMKAEKVKQNAWDSDDEVVQKQSGPRIVILKGFYTLEEIQSGVDEEEAIKQELLQEIESQIGKVQRVELYKDNPDGVCKIKFHLCSDADKCIEVMHMRWFDRRQLECGYWDGTTDYKQG